MADRKRLGTGTKTNYVLQIMIVRITSD